MNDKTEWDWQTEKIQIPIKEWKDRFNWVEEPCVSPDGKNIAAIVNLDEAEFSVCVNDEPWEEPVEKAWALSFLPDGRLASLVAREEEWTVCIDGSAWETWFDYIWALQCSADGSLVGAAVQTDGEYGMVVNDQPWETLYENLNHATMHDSGATAAVVQVVSMGQGDVDGFARGLFSVALDGTVRPEKHMNIWDIALDDSGKNVAYVFRKNRSDYDIFQKDAPWDKTFQSAWKPLFINGGTSLVAPVREGGKWWLYRDAEKFWTHAFEQLWLVTAAPDHSSIAAVVSDSFGKWTVAKDDKTWQVHADEMISDLVFSQKGETLVAVLKDHNFWTLAVNDRAWDLSADKLWRPAIDESGKIVAARFEKNGAYQLAVNGKVYADKYDMLFDPVINPDGSKIMVKSIQNGIYTRHIFPVDHFI